jgi:16S rRNA (guanine(966)-N(2))-methyltransferase RsmD
VRIIAGEFRGRRLVGPGKAPLRPTSDSLRETLFNMLGPTLDGARVLDAFAGTGALGLEALSRGAAHVTFVESDRRSLALLRKNIQICRAEQTCDVVAVDFFHAFAPLQRTFTLVLLDPPYDVKDLAQIVETAAGVLAPDGRLVLEHSRRRDTPEAVASLSRVRLRAAGDSALSFYQWS